MPLIRGYIATSLDGFIADPAGGFDFLAPYDGVDCGYEPFLAGIGTLVMGRGTFDAIAGLAAWPYRGRRSIVVTSRPVAALPPDTEAWTEGVDPLIARLRADTGPGDVWILGGGLLQQVFLDRDAVDRLEIFVVPVILGEGIRLFPGTDVRRTLRLAEAGRCGEIARLVYERA